MLTNTFIHLPGVNADLEEDFWSEGIRDWKTAFASDQLSTEQLDSLTSSQLALTSNDPVHFHDALPAGERWRLLPNFDTDTAYLDIETTGLGGEAYITMCGILDSDGFTAYVRNENLELLEEAIKKYKVIVTFNGISFDVPWIRRELGISFDHVAQVDLMHVFRRAGIKGGLKKIEGNLGFDRGDDLSELSGRDAVVLWNLAQEGEPNAMETLIRYNAEDVASLPGLAKRAYDMHAAGTPMSDEPYSPVAEFDTSVLPYDAALVEYLCS